MFKEQKDFYERFYLSLKRDRIEKLKQETRLKLIRELLTTKKNRILIAGCGIGQETGIFQERVWAFDLSFIAIKIAQGSCPGNIYLVADAGNIPFRDNLFDCVLCSEVIEHLSTPQKMLGEFSRILRPKGELIITTPNWLSCYGLARKLGEFILRKPLTAANQPIDNWYTWKALQKELAQNFSIRARRGLWYYPPLGKGNFVIPDFIALPLFYLLLPLDHLLGKISPVAGGHILAVKCIKKS